MVDRKHVTERTVAALCEAYAAMARQRAMLDERLRTSAAKNNPDDASSAEIWDEIEALVDHQAELVTLLAERNADTLDELRAKAHVLAQILSELPEAVGETSGPLSLSLAQDVIHLINSSDARP